MGKASDDQDRPGPGPQAAGSREHQVDARVTGRGCRSAPQGTTWAFSRREGSRQDADAHRCPPVAPSGMTDWGRDGQDSSGATLAQRGRVGCETPGSAHMEMPRGSWTPSLELRGALLEKGRGRRQVQTGWEPPPRGPGCLGRVQPREGERETEWQAQARVGVDLTPSEGPV